MHDSAKQGPEGGHRWEGPGLDRNAVMPDSNFLGRALRENLQNETNTKFKQNWGKNKQQAENTV